MSFIRSILKDDFYFSVIYQKPDGQEVVLGRSDRIVQPMYSLSDLNYVNGVRPQAMLISKDTLDRMEDTEAVNLCYLGMIQVAGVNEVKSVYEVLDCLPEEERQKRGANADDFKEAIRLFHLGRRAEACAQLQKIADDGRNDYVSDMYLKYITEMSDEDKANVFRFVRK